MKRMTVTKVTIGDVEFGITPFGAWKASNLSGELAKVLGPVVAGLAPVLFADGVEGFMKQDISKIIPSIIVGIRSLDGDVLEGMMRKLLIDDQNVSCKYKDENGRTHQDVLTWDLADEIFCQNLDGMFKLALEVVSLNFKGFFKNLFAQYGSQSPEAESEQTQNDTDILKVV